MPGPSIQSCRRKEMPSLTSAEEKSRLLFLEENRLNG